MKILACNMAGVADGYGTLLEQLEELARLSYRPGAVTRRSKAARDKIKAVEEVSKVTTMTVNVVTAEEEDSPCVDIVEGTSGDIPIPSTLVP